MLPAASEGARCRAGVVTAENGCAQQLRAARACIVRTLLAEPVPLGDALQARAPGVTAALAPCSTKDRVRLTQQAFHRGSWCFQTRQDRCCGMTSLSWPADCRRWCMQRQAWPEDRPHVRRSSGIPRRPPRRNPCKPACPSGRGPRRPPPASVAWAACKAARCLSVAVCPVGTQRLAGCLG